MSLRRIDMDECHEHLLRIAECFDGICRRHGIPYFMLGGTMLGAVRHKGFIPWDDDMDFGIPRPYFNRFIETAREELPDCPGKPHPRHIPKRYKHSACAAREIKTTCST